MSGNFIYSNQYIVFSASFSLKNEVALSITINPDNLCEISKCVLKTSRNGKNNYHIFMEKIGYNEIVDCLISESNVETNEIYDDINKNDLTNKYLNIEEMPEKIRKKDLNLD